MKSVHVEAGHRDSLEETRLCKAMHDQYGIHLADNYLW